MTDKTVEQLEAELKAAYAEARQLPGPRVTANFSTASPTPASPQDRYAPTVWGSTEYDFEVPSGQLCRMRKLRPEDLVGTGVLDKITRLPGFVEEQINKAEGAPPVKTALDAMPAKEDLDQLLSVLATVIPMVVVAPVLHADPAEGEERVPGRVYVSDIELGDRIAILERAVGGVQKFDNFRQEP